MPNLKAIAKQIAAQGMGGDDTLLHVQRDQVPAIAKILGHKGAVNKKTGLLSFHDGGGADGSGAATGDGVGGASGGTGESSASPGGSGGADPDSGPAEFSEPSQNVSAPMGPAAPDVTAIGAVLSALGLPGLATAVDVNTANALSHNPGPPSLGQVVGRAVDEEDITPAVVDALTALSPIAAINAPRGIFNGVAQIGALAQALGAKGTSNTSGPGNEGPGGGQGDEDTNANAKKRQTGKMADNFVSEGDPLPQMAVDPRKVFLDFQHKIRNQNQVNDLLFEAVKMGNTMKKMVG
jgi:hypothetical protein